MIMCLPASPGHVRKTRCVCEGNAGVDLIKLLFPKYTAVIGKCLWQLLKLQPGKLYRKCFFIIFVLVLKCSKLHPNPPAENKQINAEKQFGATSV